MSTFIFADKLIVPISHSQFSIILSQHYSLLLQLHTHTYLIALMKSVFRTLAFILFCTAFASCSFLPNDLLIAERLIETRPDSALHILQHLSPNEYKSDESRALYGLLMIQALDRKKLPLQPDSLLDFSIAYYQKHSNNDHLATCLLLKGRVYKYAFQYENAINSYFKALDMIENKDNYLLFARTYFDIAEIYLYQREYIKARQKYLQAYNYYVKAKSKTFAYTTLISLGISYSQERKYSKAHYYFEMVEKLTNDSLVKGYALQNLGINFYNSKQYDSALLYLRKSLPYPYLKNNRAIRYYYLADLFVDVDKADSAYYYALRCFKFNPDIRIQKECYRILVNSANAKGDIVGLKKFMIKYQYCTDSILKIDAQTKGSVIETIHTTNQEVVKTKQWVWDLIIAIFIICIISVFSYLGLRKRKENEFVAHQQKHKEEKETLHKEVMLKYSKSLLHKIENKKSEQSEKRKKLTVTEKDTLDLQLYNELLHFNDSVYFFRLMDTNLNNLVTKLRDRYIAVSDREISWCCLTLLSISYPDILLLLNYKPNALNKMKHRLAIKLQLESAFELVSFLNNILAED
jgi:tetratricopeptide (TPR) repeat protein